MSLFKTLFVDVIIPLAVPQAYTYRVPQELNEEVLVGQRVVVQFGKGKLYSGVVFKIHETAPSQYEAKYVESIIDEVPIINEYQLKLWNWMAEYYMCSLGEVMIAALPSNLRLASESNILVSDEFDGDIDVLTPKELQVLEALEVRENMSLKEVAELLSQKNVHHIVKNLIEKHVVVLEEELKGKYKPKTKSFVKLNSAYQTEDKLQHVFDELKRAQKQVNVLMKYIEMSNLFEDGIKLVDKKDLEEKAGVSSSILLQLIKKEILIKEELPIDRLAAYNKNIHEVKELSESQVNALESLKNQFENQDACLLHGVTGSGKTEVYIHLIDEFLKEGKQVLYLLPEIALTTQLIARLQFHFGNQVGIYHSKYSVNERVEVWNKVAQNLPDSPRLIIGARSASFLPFSDLGLIIVDEEHETSFKQHDPAPRYQGRDLSRVLGQLHQAKVLLGSATPSIETYWSAQQGKIGLVEMHERFGGVTMPEVLVADLQKEQRQNKMHDHFSSMLIEEIKKCIENKEQVILFQNRRGYTPLWECQMCSWTPMCNNCDVSLTYHKHLHQLKCHYCGFTMQPPTKCKACGSHEIKMLGFGTEKIEDDLVKHIHGIRVARMDLDTTRSKNAYFNLIHDFDDHKIDVLVGTQMVTKGLDFANVGLVGVLNADQMLKFPDFRSSERAFQLMEQVAGRAGRKKKRGKVIIQTFQPDNWVIQQVIKHDYLSLYKQEVLERKNFHYPPFFRLIKITLRHKIQETVKAGSQELASKYKQKLGGRVLGPETPYVSRVRNQYIMNITIKFERNSRTQDLKEFLKDEAALLRRDSRFKSLRIQFDVDPV